MYKVILNETEKICRGMNVRRKVFLVLTILWMVLIFAFSARPAEVSSEDSRSIGLLIGELFIPGFEEQSAEAQDRFAEKVDYPIRKAAHASEYALLGLLTAGAYIAGGAADMGNGNEKKKADTNSKKRTSISRGILIPWVITTAYAATDEMHQLFVPGRSGQVSDVLLDSAGAIAGLALLGEIRFLVQRRRENDCK